MRGVLVAMLLLSSAAMAAPRGRAETADQEVERLAAEAVEAYKGGRYERAVALLGRAYAIRPLAPLLYNLAKAYEKMGEDELALQYYRRYLDAGDAEPKLEVLARERVDALAAQTKAQAQADNADNLQAPILMQPKEPTPEEIAAQQRVRLALERAQTQAERERQDELTARQRGARRRALIGSGAALAAVGAVCLATGIGLYAAAAAKHDDFTASRDAARKLELKSDAESLGAGSTAMYVIGGVLAASGVALAVSGALVYAPHARRDVVSLAPWIGPASGGGVATWRF